MTFTKPAKQDSNASGRDLVVGSRQSLVEVGCHTIDVSTDTCPQRSISSAAWLLGDQSVLGGNVEHQKIKK